MSVVNVRAWTLNSGADILPDAVIKSVMEKVAGIWAQIGVTLAVDDTIKKIGITPPAAETGTTLTALVVERLADEMHDTIRSDGPGWLQVALVPWLGGWGQSYSPLTVLRPRIKGTPDTPAVMGAFPPFAGPVAIVTTKKAISDATTERQGFAALSGIGDDTAELVKVAIANDIAHEIGHLFGLWHTAELTRDLTQGYAATIPVAKKNAQHLMYETMYSEATGYRDGRSDDDAKAIIKKGFPECDGQPLTKGPRRDPQVNEGWYILFRGAQVDDADKLIVQKNIADKKVWQA
jgi:hypothetical protein